MNFAAKILVLSGVILAVTGVILLVFKKTPFWGLPGYLRFSYKSCVCFFPITSCVLISLILSLLLFFFAENENIMKILDFERFFKLKL